MADTTEMNTGELESLMGGILDNLLEDSQEPEEFGFDDSGISSDDLKNLSEKDKELLRKAGYSVDTEEDLRETLEDLGQNFSSPDELDMTEEEYCEKQEQDSAFELSQTEEYGYDTSFGNDEVEITEKIKAVQDGFNEVQKPFKDGTAHEHANKKTEQVQEAMACKEGCIFVNNREVPIKEAKRDFILTKKQYLKNELKLKDALTKACIDQIGIAKTITVMNSRVYFDNIFWRPSFKGIKEEECPPTVWVAFEDGALADYFNWQVLLTKFNVKALSIDNADFAYGIVARALCKNGQGRVAPVTFFNKLSNLYILEIAGDKINRDGLNNEDAYKTMSRKAEKVDRSQMLKRAYTWKACNDSFGFFKNQDERLQKYLNESKGVKGFFGRMLGTAAWTVFKTPFVGVKYLLKNGMKPVSDEELHG